MRVPEPLKSLLHTRIQKVSQPFPHCVLLEVYGSSTRQTWVFSAHYHYARIGKTWQIFPNPALPPIFCLWLRKRLISAEFIAIIPLHPHALEFVLETSSDQYHLIWEDNGPYSNLLLLNQQRKLQTALFNPNQPQRSLSQNQLYSPPIAWVTPSQERPHPHSEKEWDRQCWHLEKFGDLHNRKRPYIKHFKRLKKKLNRRLSKQQQDLDQCRQSEAYRQKGELLKSCLHEIHSGQTSILVKNYFEDTLPEITISLQPNLSPQENLERFFHKSRKLKKALHHVENRILQTMEELEQLEDYQYQLQSLKTNEDFETWAQKLPRFLRMLDPPRKTKNGNSNASSILTRISSDGLIILVGRNKEQNHKITFSMARGNDWWFHAQGVAGSHVVVKNQGSQLPHQTLIEAAQLAAYYSKHRSQRKVEVDYTQRKYVQKIKGGDLGQVRFSQNHTIYIELDDAMIQKSLDSLGDV